MKFLDIFSGIGGMHSGLAKAGMECVGWCELGKEYFKL
jgi:DNA (cytosine-5)-methyltransferase 1